MQVFTNGLNDQPTTCPKCGSRTDWDQDLEDQFQENHTCLNSRCGFEFKMEHDLQKEIFQALNNNATMNLFGLVALGPLRTRLSDEFQELSDDQLKQEVNALFAKDMVTGKIEFK